MGAFFLSLLLLLFLVTLINVLVVALLSSIHLEEKRENSSIVLFHENDPK
jgi:hypothetical protein